MPDKLEALPEGFVRNFLSEFGLQSTHISVLSGVLISSLSLERYVNSGVWVLAALASFGLVYVFRRQIGSRFPRAVAAALLGTGLALTPGVLYLATSGRDVTNELARFRTLTTLYLGLSICIPVAVMVLSYRKQETLFGGPYPDEIQDAITTCIVDAPLYREDQTYEVDVLGAEQATVTLRVVVAYSAVNRTKVEQRFEAQYSAPSHRHVEYVRAEVDGEALDVADRDYNRERGLTIPLDVPPGSRKRIEIEAIERFPDRASETFTAYLPTTTLTLRLRNKLGDVRFDCESLLPRKVVPVEDLQGFQVYRWEAGLLPFSGFRLYWRPLTPK